MRIIELDKTLCLTTEIYSPYPTRFNREEPPVSERQLPLVYRCDECQTEISFTMSDVEKHWYSDFTNLEDEHNNQFANFIAVNSLTDFSCLDFYCPNCKQASKFLFRCGASGYWGAFSFEIDKVLVLKP